MNRNPLEIRLLGPLRVLRDGEPLDLPPSRKARALLAYLVAVERAHPRSTLCDLFWPDADDPRAGLRWGLSKIRGIVDDDGRPRIRSTGDRVSFDSRGALVDLHRVRSVLDASAEPPLQDLREAADLFTGDFLDGLDLPGCHEHEAWCLGMRESVRTLRTSLHERLVERLRDEPAEALPHALARFTLDPLDEEACVTAMDLLCVLGRNHRAEELYELCTTIRSEYLGAEPSAELEAARGRIVSVVGPGSAGNGPGDGMPPGLGVTSLAPSPPPEHLPSIFADEPPVVGRAHERERLVDLLTTTASERRSRTVLIIGEPGIGKTRLLRELAEEVRAVVGGCLLSGRAVETEEVRPYGPWMDVLRSVPHAALEEADGWDLAGLLSGAAASTEGAGDRGRLFDAVAGLLRSLARLHSPVVVVLDDVHWLDESSAALLHYVARTVDDAPLLIACAAQEAGLGQGTRISAVVRSLEAADRLQRVPVRPLDRGETARLVAAIDPGADSSRIYASSEGNPLFALELARAHHDGSPAMPATIEQKLDERLDQLDPEALDLLLWAAALGHSFDAQVLVAVMDGPEAAIVSSLRELELGGILRVSGADRYDFSHGLLHDAAYRRLSIPPRRTVHRRIARVLDTGGHLEERRPGAVAHHAELGGLAELATRAYIEAAERVVWAFAFTEAAELAERGLRQAERLPDGRRIPLQMDILHVYTRLSMAEVRPPDLEDQVASLVEDARAAGLSEVEADGYFQLAALQYQRGDYEGTHRSSVRSAEKGRQVASDRSARILADAAVCLLFVERDVEHARRLAAEAEELAEERGSQVVQVPLARALLHHHDGELARAAEAFDEVVRLGRRVQDRWWEGPARTRRILVDLERGDPAAAASHACEAESLAGQMGDEAEAAFARALAAVASALADEDDRGAPDLGPVDDALQELRSLDSLWKLAQVQRHAAEVDLRHHRPAVAADRAAEIMHAAHDLDRPSLTVIARSLLCRSALIAGNREAAGTHLLAVEADQASRSLPSQARRAIRDAQAAFREVSTVATTVKK